VYTFNEDVLNHSRSLEELVQNMAWYYDLVRVEGWEVKPGSKLKAKSPMSFDRLIVKDISGKAPEQVEELLGGMEEGDILLIKPLYKNPDNQALWERLYQHEKVRLSIDMFGAGLLLSRKEFKVKQHFLLRSSL
jgi:hypothetical protein